MNVIVVLPGKTVGRTWPGLVRQGLPLPLLKPYQQALTVQVDIKPERILQRIIRQRTTANHRESCRRLASAFPATLRLIRQGRYFSRQSAMSKKTLR